MVFRCKDWTRQEYGRTPLYIQGGRPDWFVPNARGDEVLQGLAAGQRPDQVQERLFLLRLPDEAVPPYGGRGAYLKLEQLRELWIHLTDRCNQVCRHCLFATGPGRTRELPGAQVLKTAREAADLGCRLFALTGGEPLMHPEFSGIMQGLLDLGGTVVILSNGTRVHEYAAAIEGWPPDRVLWQISVDGLAAHHDQMRGAGAYAALLENLKWLRQRDHSFTLSCCVQAGNVADLPELVELAGAVGAAHLHLLWYFIQGRGTPAAFVAPEAILPWLTAAAEKAEDFRVSIDNLEVWRSQVFSAPGTIHDGGSSGWEALALGPDGRIYPSPALVGTPELATDLTAGLAAAWRQSPVLEGLRQATAASLTSPWRFLLGGGDPDHSYRHTGSFVGGDPYVPLYEMMAGWLIAREAARQPVDGPPGLRLKMGEVLASCHGHGTVNLTPSTCLLAAARPESRLLVQEFYQEAASSHREDIANPSCYPEAELTHIPLEFRRRSYGCGSPVLAAGLQAGERVLDLGCGPGLECFMAARQVGPAGLVVGVDMLPDMLAQAARGREEVAAALGYDNVVLLQGYLEALPLAGDMLDVAVSNCVLNLSPNKRRTFGEIFRVLKPGGRLVVADVVCEQEPPAAIRNDGELLGQCIAGALTQRDLFGLLAETGFTALRVQGRFPYRVVAGHPFFSLTFEARKPAVSHRQALMYRGPQAALVTARGELLPTGQTRRVWLADLPLGEDVFHLDEGGRVDNISLEAQACCPAPEGGGCCEPGLADQPHQGTQAAVVPQPGRLRAASGCLVCGAPLVYLPAETVQGCHYCQAREPAAVVCQEGHYVCDACHTADSFDFLSRFCTATRETDLISLLKMGRGHPAFGLHGPEHHVLVPGIILAAYRNRGGEVPPEMLATALRRGREVPGGACAFLGVCGAASGVGIAFSLLLAANPVKAEPRQVVQQITGRVIGRLAEQPAARCCQRECWLALKMAAALSAEYLPITVLAEAELVCGQAGRNRECIRERCPLGGGPGT